MFQQLLVGAVFLAAIVYLIYRFFPAVFGVKKMTSGCNSCGDNVNQNKK